MRGDMTRHLSNKHCNVRALIHKANCDCSVQRKGTNTSNQSVLPLCCYGKALDFMIKTTLDSQKSSRLLILNLHTVKIAKKCVSMPTIKTDDND